MKSLHLMLKSLALSLLIVGSALGADVLAAEKVNINTADAETLDRVLVNIGPAKAEAIVAHREANGPFLSAEQLALVKGVGLKTVEKNRDLIEIGAVPGRKPMGTAGASAARAPTGR